MCTNKLWFSSLDVLHNSQASMEKEDLYTLRQKLSLQQFEFVDIQKEYIKDEQKFLLSSFYWAI